MRKRKPKGVSELNVRYHLDCEYDTHYRCYDDSSYCYDDYCRCGVIENVTIKPPADVPSFVQYIAHTAYGKRSVITQYCIDRLLYHYKVYDVDNLDYKISPGYYGEEFTGVFLRKRQTIDSDILPILEWPEELQVEYVLEIEYGNVLEELRGLKWWVEKVLFDDLFFGQQDHLKQLDPNIVKSYESYTLPRGICIPLGDKYRVIDGYHRCSATPVKGKKPRSLTVLVGKKS